MFPLPLGVNDLQVHPSEADVLAVTSFRTPIQASYSISAIAARRVLAWGGTSTLKVYDNNGTEISSITADSQDWSIDSSTYDLGEIDAGQFLYFAVQRDGDFIGDATEIAWSITATEQIVQPPVVNTFGGITRYYLYTKHGRR